MRKALLSFALGAVMTMAAGAPVQAQFQMLERPVSPASISMMSFLPIWSPGNEATPVEAEPEAETRSIEDIARAVDDLLAVPEPAPSLPAPLPSVEAEASSGLAGRTIAVRTVADIVLRPGEVVLTFDDGPRPGRTEPILDALDAFGVKATFLMLGRQAEAHPQLAREVALRGHTIGSHTYSHPDLARVEPWQAAEEIEAGYAALAAALAPAGLAPSHFFRFPYLSQSGFLRVSLADQGRVVLGVDIDSKDYYDETPQQVLERTLAQLGARGSGIVLFHDIHARTGLVLPEFLWILHQSGYRVVHLVPAGPAVEDPLFLAAGRELRGPVLLEFF